MVSMLSSQPRDPMFESIARQRQYGLVSFHSIACVYLNADIKLRSCDLTVRQEWKVSNADLARAEGQHSCPPVGGCRVCVCMCVWTLARRGQKLSTSHHEKW